MIYALVLFFQFTASAQWFNLTNGDTNCRANLVAASPLQFSYFCGNVRGATAGSYTASTSNTATDSVTVGLAGPSGAVLCVFAVNATAAPVALDTFTTLEGSNPTQWVPPDTISWQCSANGQTTGNSGSTSLKGTK